MEGAASVGVEDGRPVVRRRAGGADRDALRGRAARLERARHPGVVGVVASRPWRDGWELVIEHGGPPVAAAHWGRADEVAALGAAVASTLADLHERGVVHGRLDASRILIGREGGPVLCGFAPPGPSGQVGADAADDVAALGRVLAALLERLGPSSDPTLPTLRQVVAGIAADPPSRRPTARRLAAELGALSPRPPGRRRRRAPGRPGRSAAVGLLVVVVVLVVVLRRPVSRAGVAPSSTTPTPAATTGAPRCVATERASIAAAECGHDVRVEGARVVLDGNPYVVGIDGDVVAVADWDCAGGLRAAVLRPATAEVRVFGAFTADRVLSVARADRVAAGAPVDSLGVRAEGGCAVLGVLPVPAEAGTARQP